MTKHNKIKEMAINKLNIALSVLVLFYLNVVNCLYEDQVGKFDWKQSYIGKLKFVEFDSVKRIIVGTEENVLASLHLKNGQIGWRHVLENKHSLELLHLGTDIVTVSGDGNIFYIRGWDITYGTSNFEWTIYPEKDVTSKWLINNDKLIHVVPILNSHLEITTYQYNTGQNTGSTAKVAANWITDLDKCVLTGVYWACVTSDNSEGELLFMDVTKPQVYKKRLDHLIGNTTGTVQIKAMKDGSLNLIRNDVKRLINIKENDVEVLPYGFNFDFVSLQNGDHSLLIEISRNGKLRTIQIEDKTDETIDIPIIDLEIPLIPVSGICRGQACRLVVKGIDDSISLMQLPSGKILWTREEALSNVLSVKFIELPVSEMDASIEREFATNGDIFGTLYRRLSNQLRQISTFISGQKLESDRDLIRDDFGFHKIILLVTKVGKVYSIDSLTGAIIWSKYIPNIKPFQGLDKEYFILFEQRNARYHPIPALCTLIARNSLTNYGVLYVFDPNTGDLDDRIIRTNYKIKQAMLLPFEGIYHIKGVLLMADNDEVYAYPESALRVLREHQSNLYMYTVDNNNQKLQGYALKLYDKSVKATKTWEMHLDVAKIIALSVKPSVEKVHSQGRVLSDRSVLYKYVNPNLLAIATLSPDPLHKNVLSIYLIDGITGLVIYSVNHKRAKGPIKLVHSENWIVYSYMNEKFRRNEIASVELYEGITQSNSTVFSSFALSQLPHVETQAYILPVNPQVMTTTLTERGITNKHLLLALSSGYVAELPWAILEPRGTQLATPEEGFIPYIPELPIPPESYINYNQTLERINGIYVSPARLESTSLVLIYGLDLFYTRVAPSKTFDVLKEDFDHWLIVTVLSGLIVASYITKQLASRKALKQAWK